MTVVAADIMLISSEVVGIATRQTYASWSAHSVVIVVT